MFECYLWVTQRSCLPQSTNQCTMNAISHSSHFIAVPSSRFRLTCRVLQRQTVFQRIKVIFVGWFDFSSMQFQEWLKLWGGRGDLCMVRINIQFVLLGKCWLDIKVRIHTVFGKCDKNASEWVSFQGENMRSFIITIWCLVFRFGPSTLDQGRVYINRSLYWGQVYRRSLKRHLLTIFFVCLYL